MNIATTSMLKNESCVVKCRTLLHDGYPEMLCRSLHKHNISIAVLSEIRFAANGLMDMRSSDANYKLLFSGDDQQGQLGVGIAINASCFDQLRFLEANTPAHGIPRMEFRAWHSAHVIPRMAFRDGIQRMPFRVCHSAHGIPHMAFCVWHSAHGIPRMAFRAWHSAHGIPRMAFRAWHSAYGIPRMAFRVGHSAHGIPRMAFGSQIPHQTSEPIHYCSLCPYSFERYVLQHFGRAHVTDQPT